MEWGGKRVALLGLGRSNRGVARYLSRQGAHLVALDAKSSGQLGDAYRELRTFSCVEFRLGPDYLDHLRGFDAIFVSPGVKKHIPQLLRAEADGALVTTEIAHFLMRCAAPVMGITGSSGKTTTTTLVAQIMEKAWGRPVHLGGNIGTVLIERVEDIRADELVVLELSSFQLQMVRKSPHWGALINVRPNHLDIHRDYREYQEAKANIFRFQEPQDYLVFNEDDEVSRRLAQQAPGRTLPFGRLSSKGKGARLINGQLAYVNGGGVNRVLAAGDLKLKGLHNVENALAAIALVSLAGVDTDTMAEVLATFRGVEHRLEEVANHGGVLFVNDSIATTPDRTLAALAAMTSPVLLIAGGYDKHLSFRQLPAAMRGKVRVLLTLGTTAPRIEEEVRRLATNEQPHVIRCQSLSQAVMRASQLAQPGDTVLLSPACASFDMFGDYEERGHCFKQLVQSLV